MERAYQQNWFLSFTLFLVFHFKFLMPLGFTSSRSLSCESKPIGSAIPNELNYGKSQSTFYLELQCTWFVLHKYTALCVISALFQCYLNNLHAVIICVFRVRRHFSASSCVSHTVIICSVITWLSIL